MLFLKLGSGTSAASGPTLQIGPCLDSTGAEYTGLVIGDLTLGKNGTEAAMAANATLTHVSNGHYTLVMIGNNADTLGRAVIRCNKSGYQFPPKEFMVLPAMIYDSLVAGSDRLDTNVTHIGDTAQTARDIGASVLLSSGTGTGQLSLSSGAVLLQATQTGVTIPTVTTVGTLTTYTGNTPQTGDSYARIGATGSGLTSLAQSSAYTSTRAGYLDNINNANLSILAIGRDGAVASSNRGYLSKVNYAMPFGANPANTLYVRTSGDGGSDSNDGSSATDDGGGIGPFLTVQKAIDTINGGGYAFATTKINWAGAQSITSPWVIPANTWLSGDGSTDRSGTSVVTLTVANANAAVSALDNAVLQAFKIVTSSTTSISPPIGYGATQTAARNVIVIDVDTSADSDGAIHTRTTNNNGYWRYYNCEFNYKWDGAVIIGEGATAVADYFNCTWTQIGNSTIGSAGDTRAIAGTGGLQRFFNCTISASTHITSQIAVAVHARGSMTVELHNCTITGPTSQPTDGYNLYQTDRAQIVVYGCTHTNATYSTYGSIIDGEAGVDWSKTRNITASKNFTNTTVGAVTSVSGATVSAYLVDKEDTWTFNNATETTASKIIKKSIGFNGLVAMDFSKLMPDLTSISSITSATFADISGTEPTVSTTAVSADKKKAVITLATASATANTYTITVKVLTADSQTVVGKGRITLS